MHDRIAFACFASFLLVGLAAQAQFTNKSSVLDGSGATSSNGPLTNISASGQPGGITESSGGSLVNHAGFLNTFFLMPGLDTDEDGVADEADRDNDNDALTDAAEIGGDAFNPVTGTSVNNSDTDSDGMNDGQEAVAGTDPTDFNARFGVLAITNGTGGRSIAWRARGNGQKTYVVRSTENATQPYASVAFSGTVSGGASPWFAVTSSWADATATNAEFYAVEVYP